MSTDLQRLKAAVTFRDLVAETHDVDRSGKVLCPVHADHTPSCHIYPDGAHCYACGWHGDTLDWLCIVHDLSTAEAIKELERRAGGYIPPVTERPVKASRSAPTFKPITAKALLTHLERVAKLDHVPAALKGRGFSLSDLKKLGIGAVGADAVLAITGPDGVVLALKRRFAAPKDGVRYRYPIPGHGTPAWCSADFLTHDRVLIVEGELNAMACSLACPEIAVMGVAGTGGALHLEALIDRTVYVYGDGDDPGQKAREKWAVQAQRAGAEKVFVLEPWDLDACDLAGSEGYTTFKKRLALSLKNARSFGAVERFSALNTALNNSREGRHKPLLGHSGSRFSSRPVLGVGSAPRIMVEKNVTDAKTGHSRPVLGGKPCL